jgi:hypothetical protein
MPNDRVPPLMSRRGSMTLIMHAASPNQYLRTVLLRVLILFEVLPKALVSIKALVCAKALPSIKQCPKVCSLSLWSSIYQEQQADRPHRSVPYHQGRPCCHTTHMNKHDKNPKPTEPPDCQHQGCSHLAYLLARFGESIAVTFSSTPHCIGSA